MRQTPAGAAVSGRLFGSLRPSGRPTAPEPHSEGLRDRIWWVAATNATAVWAAIPPPAKFSHPPPIPPLSPKTIVRATRFPATLAHTEVERPSMPTRFPQIRTIQRGVAPADRLIRLVPTGSGSLSPFRAINHFRTPKGTFRRTPYGGSKNTPTSTSVPSLVAEDP